MLRRVFFNLPHGSAEQVFQAPFIAAAEALHCDVHKDTHMIDGEQVYARSRTFIRATLSDNPDLARTNYASVWRACRKNCVGPIATVISRSG